MGYDWSHEMTHDLGKYRKQLIVLQSKKNQNLKITIRNGEPSATCDYKFFYFIFKNHNF